MRRRAVMSAGASELLRELTDAERTALRALVDDVIPADDAAPGALEAGAADFIERAIRGDVSRWFGLYETGLAGIDAHCTAAYGVVYAECTAEQRADALDALSAGEVDGDWAQAFYGVLSSHTTQGYLSDPAYGGNRDMIGWKAVGFPGAQYGYTDEDQTYGRRFTLRPVSRADARAAVEAEPDKYFNSY